jgi:slit protein 2
MNPIAMPLIGNQKQTVQKIEQAIGCEANDCQNGGICFKMAINGQLEAKTRCKCPLGYSGDKCAVMSLVNFQYEDSYLELESPELDTQFNLTFTILTDAENGVLFYHGSKAKHHMAVELFKGRIRISFDVGNTPSSTMFSYAKVNDSKFIT